MDLPCLQGVHDRIHVRDDFHLHILKRWLFTPVIFIALKHRILILDILFYSPHSRTDGCFHPILIDISGLGKCRLARNGQRSVKAHIRQQGITGIL